METVRISDGEVFYFDKAKDAISSRCTRHYHDSFEIYYLKSGSCNYFIDDALYNVQQGDIVLIPSGVIHKTNYDGKPHTRLLINCSSDYIPESVRGKIDSMIYIYRSPSVQKQAEQILEKIGRDYELNDEFREDSLSHLMAEFFILLARNTSRVTKSSTGSPFIEETVGYIKENYMCEITLSEVAKMHSVSPEHLSRSFKKETGLGFSEYLNLVRLQMAEYMLKNEPGKSVSEIAYACGFNDSNYFSDKFKKTYGLSPSRLKIRLAKNN